MSTPALSLRSAWARPARAVPLGGLGAIALAALVLGLLSLLAPTTPTYDPYAWLIWGREVLHLDLDTRMGPSWKPLPVLFTTVFGLVPSAAPDLWVAVARAGAIAAIALAFRVTRRLGGGVAGGLVAAACLAASTGFLRFSALGDSEGLLVALLLAAADLHLSGRRRAALWVAFAACLLRPEAWPFAALYAAWLWRAEPRVRVTVVGMVAGGLVLWFGPELWGSGDALRAGSRARDPNPNAIAFADHPALEAVKRTLSMTPLPALLGFAAVAIGWATGWWRDRRVGVVALAALAWVALVAAMTEAGFSGNARYMIAPVALLCVAGGTGWGHGFALVGRGRGGAAAAAGAALALLAGGALLIAPASKLGPDARSVRDEARLYDALSGAVHAVGGAGAVHRCGAAATGPFQVTPLAWRLDATIGGVTSLVEPRLPGSVFRGGPPPRDPPGAPRVTLHDDRWAPVARSGPWEVLQACRTPAGG
jgi:hypothetical protein